MVRKLSFIAILCLSLSYSGLSAFAQETRPHSFNKAMKECLEITENAVKIIGKQTDVQEIEKYLVRCLENKNFIVGLPSHKRAPLRIPLNKPTVVY